MKTYYQIIQQFAWEGLDRLVNLDEAVSDITPVLRALDEKLGNDESRQVYCGNQLVFPVYASLGMCHRNSHYAVHDDCEAAIAPRLLHPSDRCHDGATLPPTRWVPYSTAINKRPIEGIARHCHDCDLTCIVAKRRLQDSFTSVMPVASLTARTPLYEVGRYRTYSG